MRQSGQAPLHRAQVIGSPWRGVYATEIDSAVHFGRHWHATFGLGLLVQGAQRSASGQGSVDAYAGDLITTNPGEVHDGRPLGSTTRRWHIVYLEPAFVATEWDDARAWTGFAHPVLRDPGLRDAVVRLHACLARWSCQAGSDAAVRLACEEALAATLARLSGSREACAHRPEADARLSIVRDCLGDQLLDPPTLADLAALSGLSKFKLLRCFERAFGVPPFAWLTIQRLERARRHIRDGLGLAGAAAAAGFADQSHMSRTFTRHFGFTPGAWRRAVRAGRGASPELQLQLQLPVQ